MQNALFSLKKNLQNLQHFQIKNIDSLVKKSNILYQLYFIRK